MLGGCWSSSQAPGPIQPRISRSSPTRRPPKRRDFERKLNNQIAHLMDGRTDVEANKIDYSTREELLRWIDTELRRWLPLRGGAYANIAVPSVNLALIPPAGATVTADGSLGSTNAIGSVGGPIGGMSALASPAPSQPPSTQAQIRKRILIIWLSAAAFIALVILYRFYVGDS